jgi:hypothetical protein
LHTKAGPKEVWLRQVPVCHDENKILLMK